MVSINEALQYGASPHCPASIDTWLKIKRELNVYIHASQRFVVNRIIQPIAADAIDDATALYLFRSDEYAMRSGLACHVH